MYNRNQITLTNLNQSMTDQSIDIVREIDKKKGPKEMLAVFENFKF